MINEFRIKLKEDKVNIIKEIKGRIPELIVDKIPGKMIPKTGMMRDKLYDFDPFFIKNHDGGKYGSYLKPIKELRKEVEQCLNFKDNKILIVEKIAILHLEKYENEVFLVEKKLEPFNEEVWKNNKRELYDKAYSLYEKAKKEYPNIKEIKLDHIGYDPIDKKLKFFDVFP